MEYLALIFVLILLAGRVYFNEKDFETLQRTIRYNNETYDDAILKIQGTLEHENYRRIKVLQSKIPKNRMILKDCCIDGIDHYTLLIDKKPVVHILSVGDMEDYIEKRRGKI